MKRMYSLLMLMVLSSMSIVAQERQEMTLGDGVRYEGEWPVGEGVLYSHEDGLILGTFSKGKPEGECVCYKPNGEVYWGEYKKGKATGHGYLFKDSGEVIIGEYKNGLCHGIDTVFCGSGHVTVGVYKKGVLKESLYTSKTVPGEMLAKKPSYPRIDFRSRQEDFLKDMEIRWENKTVGIKQPDGFAHPSFQGGTIEDFAFWLNSRVELPSEIELDGGSRTVLVEFTVDEDGKVVDAHAVFGSNVVLNEAAVDAVSKSPKWEPAEYNGQKVASRMTIPVVFNAK